MTRHIIDTNFLLRIIVNDDIKQSQKVLDFIEQAVNKNWHLFVDKSVVFEIIYVLGGKRYQLNREEIFTKINDLFNINCFTFEHKNLLVQSLKMFREANLDIVDCYLIIRSLSENFQFQSFDKKAVKLYEVLIKKEKNKD